MKRLMLAASIVFTVAAAPTVGRAASLEPTRVPADVQYFAHVDVKAALSSTLGQLVLADLRALGLDEKIDHVKQFFGIDPLQAIEAMTLYGYGPGEQNAVLIVEMGSNLGRLPELVREADAYEQKSYRGFTIHSWKETKKGHDHRQHCAVYPSGAQDMTLLVFGHDYDRVTAAVDLLEGQGRTLGDVSRGVLASAPGRGSHLFFAGVDVHELGKHRRHRAAQTAVIDMGERDGLSFAEARLTTETAEQAAQMAQMFTGMLAMAQLAGPNADAPVARLARGVVVDHDGQTVTAEFTYDAAELFADLKAMKANHHGHDHDHHHGDADD